MDEADRDMDMAADPFLEVGGLNYGNTGCGVFQRRDTKLKRFSAKNQLQLNEITKFGELCRAVQWQVVKK